MADLTEPIPAPTFYSGQGLHGLRRSSGQVQEEFVRDLLWPRGLRVYREMVDNDPMIGGFMMLVGGLFRTMEWKTEPFDPEKPEDVEAADFGAEELNNLRPSIREQLSSALDMFPFGFALAELIYKRRDDGRIGWEEWRWLAPESLSRWVFDRDTDRAVAFVQQPPSDYIERVIPLQRCCHLRTSRRKGNPEGKSILRNAWRSWYFKTKLEEIEAIGCERDLAGLPMMKIPIKYMVPNAPPEDQAVYEAAKKLVRNVRRDEHEGIVVPSDYDKDGKPLIEFSLVSTGGSRAIDVGAVIDRYDARIAMSVLADFLLLGHSKTGTFALSSDKSTMFTTAFAGFADILAEELTSQIADQLCFLNALKGRFKLVHGEFEKTDVTMYTTALANMAKVGIIVPGEPNLEAAVRDLLNLPEPDPEWEKEQEAKDQEQMDLMREQMTAEGAPPGNANDKSSGKDQGGVPNDARPGGAGGKSGVQAGDAPPAGQ